MILCEQPIWCFFSSHAFDTLSKRAIFAQASAIASNNAGNTATEKKFWRSCGQHKQARQGQRCQSFFCADAIA